MKNYVKGSIIGAIVGDAMGVPYEFSTQKEMKQKPCTTMTGNGTYNQPTGTWSDDSSMIIATMDSLKNGLDYEDMIDKFCDWIFNAKYTPHDDVFDYGKTTYKALENRNLDHKEPLSCGMTGERDNGNGSLMRILPASIYCYYNEIPTSEQIKIINNISSLTHAHRISEDSCNIYNFIIQEILKSKEENKEEPLNELITMGLDKSRQYYDSKKHEEFHRIYSTLLLDEDRDIGSTGYVVDSLETAIHISYFTDSYKNSILDTVNLGGDTDTNAVITGGITGLYYGYDKIPDEWLNKLVKKDTVVKYFNEFYNSLS